MEKTHQEIIKETVADLLHKMGFEAMIEVTVQQDGPESTFFCMARVEHDQNLLIGQYGVNLAAIQHLVRVMLRKKTTEKLSVVVDVNDYFSGKRDLLEKEAKRAASEAVENNTSVMLRPMLPYERKIVHSFLAGNPEVITESIGKGDERKVGIHPKPKEK
ncbi:MAG: hypothetical protein A3E38_01680 [Candidatus Moranbacteria bacterium RIFCSPHIGHO2_12_FULL_54_9]|nr:MAG: hypothetical protein A2878_00905 [Candidatus Moranbacteria bacterium RIFCSPHIGHO2_01_FULL_54_31]OGI26001.1 MAG: hypothetical protein A3E38_01680 [Candidatus Moranbacteria bacterium RIFCSPHIGHO2_12_FULL_54_9]